MLSGFELYPRWVPLSFGKFILKSKFLSAYFICFQKYQNASVRDNIYNAHVGFREW